jgi:putative DNA primase/helicase
MQDEQQRREHFTAYAATLQERFSKGMLAELQKRSQWVLWRKEPVSGQQKHAPYNPKGYHASAIKPETWASLTAVLGVLKDGRYQGIGFMLSPNDHYCFVGLHQVYDGVSKQITSPEASRIVTRLASYTEASKTAASTNNDLHVLVRATLPGKGFHSDIEMRDRGSFVIITTRCLTETSNIIEHRQVEIEELYNQHKRAFRSDEELLERAMNARNGSSFRELWIGTWQGNPRYLENGKLDYRKADWQLIKNLLYWTNGNEIQTDRLFRNSALMRDEWDDSTYSGGSGYTYGEITIYNALQQPYHTSYHPKVGSWPNIE